MRCECRCARRRLRRPRDRSQSRATRGDANALANDGASSRVRGRAEVRRESCAEARARDRGSRDSRRRRRTARETWSRSARGRACPARCAAPGLLDSRSSTPMSSRMRDACGLMYSEHGLSRGKRARSSTSTSTPARARKNAVAAPAGPPPTTMTCAPSRLTLTHVPAVPVHARSRRDPRVPLGGQVQRVAADAVRELERPGARRQVRDANGLRQRFPPRVDGLRVGEPGGVVARDGQPAGGAVGVEAPRRLARAGGAVAARKYRMRRHVPTSPGALVVRRSRLSRRSWIRTARQAGRCRTRRALPARQRSSDAASGLRSTTLTGAQPGHEHGDQPPTTVHTTFTKSFRAPGTPPTMRVGRPQLVHATLRRLGATVAPAALLYGRTDEGVGQRPGNASDEHAHGIVDRAGDVRRQAMNAAPTTDAASPGSVIPPDVPGGSAFRETMDRGGPPASVPTSVAHVSAVAAASAPTAASAQPHSPSLSREPPRSRRRRRSRAPGTRRARLPSRQSARFAPRARRDGSATARSR